MAVKEKQEEGKRAEQVGTQAPDKLGKAWATPTRKSCLLSGWLVQSTEKETLNSGPAKTWRDCT